MAVYRVILDDEMPVIVRCVSKSQARRIALRHADCSIGAVRLATADEERTTRDITPTPAEGNE